MSNFSEKLRKKPFESYDEYMTYLFACVNSTLDTHLKGMKRMFASEQGGYKNVLYPDLEIAHDVTKEHIAGFEEEHSDGFEEYEELAPDGDEDEEEEGENEQMDDDLLSLLGAFAVDQDEPEEEEDYIIKRSPFLSNPASEQLQFVNERAELTVKAGIRMPFYEICKKLKFDYFTQFCFVCAVLSSTQTDYSSIFQVVNGNGGISSPTIESAAKLYYGNAYSITKAYSDMSTCLEQLLPIFDLRVITSMPFSTQISPDKRLIDFLFGKDPYKTDENYARYFSMLSSEEPGPVLANENVLDAMGISYNEGIRIFAYDGDEGSGRKFFIKHFCKKKSLRAITMNCKKLFATDYSFVDHALWAITRECILTGACAVLEDLTFREETKEQFNTYMDMAFTKLTDKDITVFTTSKERMDFKDITKKQVTYLTLPAPDIDGRVACWNYFSESYKLAADVDKFEMATKFLFTAGKISDALRYAKSLAAMEKNDEIERAILFKGCNAQMSSELSQKATRVEAKFGFDDIVMNADQRETITHAIEQMMYKKQVYEEWNYMKKYPYGRGLTVLLFGAPGTGKSMMAQVLAHELNLELYRVDISKVVDKYVGETEKSLSMIFREAKKCNVVLFFDECDTIFAKRSDDGGSNQASANNKTALLLQEMEAYDGVCVLATNYKHNIDPAFFRRMKYIVEFQFPNPDTREMLWKTTVPKTTPLADDVDFRFIAEKFEFAGGNIKNCILNAAFLAAADPDSEGMVHMKHYLQAIRYEYVKTGKVFTRADFEPFATEVFGPPLAGF